MNKKDRKKKEKKNRNNNYRGRKEIASKEKEGRERGKELFNDRGRETDSQYSILSSLSKFVRGSTLLTSLPPNGS